MVSSYALGVAILDSSVILDYVYVNVNLSKADLP
jgi:hypothetical protein